MITTIARHEIRSQLRDGRFRWSGAIVFVLLLFSLALGLEQHRRVVTERERVQVMMRQQWLDQGQKNPHSAAHFSIYALQTPLALAFFDRGVEPYTGSAIWLEAHYQNAATYAPARDATSLARFGQLTAAATMQLIIPLLIIVLAAGTLAGERENGSLRFVASLGVSPRRLAAGKALGVVAALLGLLLPAAALGAVTLLVSGGVAAADGVADAGSIALSGENAGSGAVATLSARGFFDIIVRASALTGGYLIYFAVFLALALAISAIASGTRQALLLLLTIWC